MEYTGQIDYTDSLTGIESSIDNLNESVDWTGGMMTFFLLVIAFAIIATSSNDKKK